MVPGPGELCWSGTEAEGASPRSTRRCIPIGVLALVLYNSWARTAWAPDYQVGTSKEELGRWRTEIEEHWGTEHMANGFLERRALACERPGVGPVGG